MQIADGVNLTTGVSGINFQNANDATLTFNGSSTVTGDVGSVGNTNNNVLAEINAGVSHATNTFLGDVYVSNSTFHVTGNGIVNLEGDLYGPLVFDSGSVTGSVNMANGESIIVSSGPAVNSHGTYGAGKGTINFVGGTTLTGDIGTIGSGYVSAANFHNVTSDGTNTPLYIGSVSQTLDNNIYASTTTIGNALVNAPTVANIGGNIFLGDTLTLSPGATVATSTTTLNTAGVVEVLNNSVVFDHISNADGTLTNVATISQSTTGHGPISTNGGTLNFAVGTVAYDPINGGGLIDPTASSSITGDTGSTLVMNGYETVNVSLLGSMRDGQTYALINVAGGSDSAVPGTYIDNSYTIDTTLSRVNGDLVLTANRDENTYVTKSGTVGNFSNNAAIELGALGAAGTGYNSDMQLVFNLLDLDQWGYGNNQANLATQIQKLAPIANASLVRSAWDTNAMVWDTSNTRLAGLRGDTLSVANDLEKGVSGGNTANTGFWLKMLGSTITQNQQGSYDGYKTNAYGVVVGFDRRVTHDLILGFDLAAATARVNQADFRDGDSTRINDYQITAYGSYDFTHEWYLDGSLNYVMNNYSGTRATALDRIASSNYDGKQYGASLGTGYKINVFDKTTFIPTASIAYNRLKQDAYSETGAGSIGLNVQGQSYGFARLGLGARLLSEFSLRETIFRPEIDFNWYHNAGSLSKNVVSSFIGGGDTFVTPSVSLDSNYANVGLGLGIQATSSTDILIRYDLTTSSGFNSNTGSLTGRYVF